MRSTEELYRLQAVDLEQDRIRAALEGSELEDRAREAEARVESLRGTLDRMAEAVRELSRQLRRLELEAESARQEQRRSEEGLYGGTVTSSKELGHLQQRAERAARQAEAMEAQGLERMEEAETLEAQRKELERTLRAAEDEARQLRMEREMERDQLQFRLEELGQERADLLSRVAPDSRVRYERMRRQMPNPIAPVSKGRCGGCHVGLSQRTIDRLRADQGLVQCEQCGRILHLL